MPYKNPEDRPYKKEYALQKARGEHDNRMERQRGRRKKEISGYTVYKVKALPS